VHQHIMIVRRASNIDFGKVYPRFNGRNNSGAGVLMHPSVVRPVGNDHKAMLDGRQVSSRRQQGNCHQQNKQVLHETRVNLFGPEMQALTEGTRSCANSRATITKIGLEPPKSS